MAAGLFADDTKLIFDHQVFIDCKPTFYILLFCQQDLRLHQYFATDGNAEGSASYWVTDNAAI